jgi:hypothetical protein
MNKKLAVIVGLLVWVVGAYFFSSAAIAAKRQHSQWVVENSKDISHVVMPSPEQDVRSGLLKGLGLASALALVVWGLLRALAPVDENAAIGRAVIDEAMETVKGGVRISKEQERTARRGFWERFNGLFER